MSILSMAFYVTETGLQLNDALTQTDFLNLVILMTLLVAPLVISNLTSAILVLRNMDFSGKNCGKAVCALLHFCQMGLIWRCLKLFMLYDEKDWKEFLTLRVLHTTLQSLPYVIAKGVLMLKYSDNSAMSFASLTVTILSSSLVLSMFNLGPILFESDEFLDYKARRRKPFGILFVMFGTLLILLSRCSSILLMASILPIWVSIPLGTHFLLYVFSSTLYKKYNGKLNIKSFFVNITHSYLALFDVVISEFHKIECRYVLYYTFILVENIVMTALWMIMSNENYVFKLSLVVIILTSFIFGIILKCCSCGYVQPDFDSDEPISEDTLDFARYITKAAAAEKQLNQNGHISPNGRAHRDKHHRSPTLPGRNNGSIEIETIYSPDVHSTVLKSPKSKQTHKSISSSISGSNTQEEIVNAKLTKYRYAQNMRENADKRVLAGESNGDLASSNSRNTNTLNQSGRSKHNHTNEDNELQHYNERAKSSGKGSGKHLSSPKKTRPVLGVRSSSPQKIDSGNFCQSPQSKRNSSKRKDIPLFPNECNDLIGSKAFGSPKAKHILSNSVSEYHMDDSYSDTSYSEYLSYSYYVDSTDWSSVSCDSDCALTWPPSSRIELVNLHSLPKEKICTADSVRVWLSKLDKWEPSYDQQTFEYLEEFINSSNSKSLQNLTGKGETELVRRSSSIHGHRPTILKMGRRQEKSVDFSKEMSRYVSEITQVPPLSLSTFTPMKSTSVSESDDPNRAPFKDRSPRENKSVIVWHDDIDSTHQDVVQESVV